MDPLLEELIPIPGSSVELERMIRRTFGYYDHQVKALSHELRTLAGRTCSAIELAGRILYSANILVHPRNCPEITDWHGLLYRLTQIMTQDEEHTRTVVHIILVMQSTAIGIEHQGR